MKWLDSVAERSTRSLSRRTSRRSILGSLGTMLLGASVLPLLPVARGAKAAEAGGNSSNPAGVNDPSSCEYWRHCAIDGFACSCCGGSQSACPPGTEMSLVTWVGTCHNPADGKSYAISYNDCCGKSPCGRCLCNRNERDTPLYVPFQSNDYNWCSGSSKTNIPYHCSTARIVGEAK
jgi:methylamine dehydrogenase light chain